MARAMIQGNPMLILDEATSSVDTRTELITQQAMDRLTEHRTSFVIAHQMCIRDSLSFRRIVNVPKRNLGKRRMAFLQEYAERQGRSLYQALQDNLEDPLFKGTGVGRFVGLIESFAAGYGGRPVSEVLSALLNESGYEKMLRTEGSQERLDNLAELKQSVYEYETTCGEEDVYKRQVLCSRPWPTACPP